MLREEPTGKWRCPPLFKEFLRLRGYVCKPLQDLGREKRLEITQVGSARGWYGNRAQKILMRAAPPRGVSRPFVELGGKPRSEDSSGT